MKHQILMKVYVICSALVFGYHTVAAEQPDDYVVACYVVASSATRPGSSKFKVTSAAANLCTDVIFGFAKISVPKRALKVTNQEEKIILAELLQLKNESPDLRLLLALGGEETGDAPFDEIVKTWSVLQDFSKNVAAMLRHRGFDGLEIAWTTQDYRKKNSISRLCQALHDAFLKESSSSGEEKLLLTFTAIPNDLTVKPMYNPTLINQYVDRITVLAFNYENPSEPLALHSSPLHNTDSSAGGVSQSGSMKWWTRNGVPAKKLILGLAAFGRTFVKAAQRGNMRPSDKKSIWSDGPPGPYTGLSGYLSFYEICQMEQRGQLLKKWNAQWKAPMAFGQLNNSLSLVSFQDSRSFKEKAFFAKSEGYGGIMIWSLDLDDFDGKFCNSSSYPLLHSAVSVLRKKSVPDLFSIEKLMELTSFFGIPVMWVLLIASIGVSYNFGFIPLKKEAEKILDPKSYRVY
ncbi:hypothetical protein EGW08_022968 [Elysia chlorotica]|uniref:GH18 domain-containing protein n=1 Tax=Elysia chlorotica TaxID=188477 RepID=A0A433SJS4_ELYCH|nr:hypothetical protein EGW08_022968 [Elysia chlorotica]